MNTGLWGSSFSRWSSSHGRYIGPVGALLAFLVSAMAILWCVRRRLIMKRRLTNIESEMNAAAAGADAPPGGAVLATPVYQVGGAPVPAAHHQGPAVATGYPAVGAVGAPDAYPEIPPVTVTVLPPGGGDQEQGDGGGKKGWFRW